MTSAHPALPDDICHCVRNALAEDVRSGDLTASLVAPNARVVAQVVTRESAVLCGIAWFEQTIHQLDPAVRIDWQHHDGDCIDEGATVCRIEASARTLLTAERTALNFLQTLSGTASITRAYADAVADYPVRILDTRKTLPGLRTAQKYAVRVGGGCNHRFGLYDGVLLKENHQAANQSLRSMIDQVTAKHDENILIEVEIETCEQLEDAIQSGANRIMLDNFSLTEAAEAVQLNRGRVELEVSGNIDLDSIRDWAQTGVDYISVGALTKNIRAIDFSMIFSTCKES